MCCSQIDSNKLNQLCGVCAPDSTLPSTSTPSQSKEHIKKYVVSAPGSCQLDQATPFSASNHRQSQCREMQVHKVRGRAYFYVMLWLFYCYSGRAVRVKSRNWLTNCTSSKRLDTSLEKYVYT